MSNEARFEKAYPYQKDGVALPVTDLDAASDWYSRHFGMTEVEQCDRPVPTVILGTSETARGSVSPSTAATRRRMAPPCRVTNIREVKAQLESNGATVGNWRVDEHEGQKLQVFFVVAPDGLCYYFHEPIE